MDRRRQRHHRRLCKYASFTEGKPYAVFFPPPFMNGYLSANASITLDGVKQSLPRRIFQQDSSATWASSPRPRA